MLLILAVNAYSQVSINADGSNADGSAMLDVKSIDKGFLPPRMTETQRDAISSPTTGLIIYQTDGKTGLYSFNGLAWTAVRTKTYSVGDFAQGGIVFWLDETGEHGLVCAKSNQDGGSGIRWYAGTNTYTMAKGDGPYAGELNTAIIIANQGNGDGNTYAARVCNELQITENGKTYCDWYLPSKNELRLMYLNKTTIYATATANGGVGLGSNYYWSSTEYNNANVWIQNFDLGDQTPINKDFTVKVRAVRAF